MSKAKSSKELKKPVAADKPAAAPDGGWRETIESVAMAVILALLFRGFVAEAFVIPTGSMAPTLDGRHKDLKCPKCGKWYEVTCSSEQRSDGSLTGMHVINGTCPICRYTQRLNPLAHPNEGSFSGDRIIVGKFCYDLNEPKRWDVIVFKPPGNESTNYIKRLIGLPNEKIFIMGGNIYTCDRNERNEPDGSPPKALRIARKPPAKLNAMLQIVDDSDFVSDELVKLGWPSRWQNWSASGGDSDAWKMEDGGRGFSIAAKDSEQWLRYRHLVPSYDDWRQIEETKALPPGVGDRVGELIADYYAYNTTTDQAIWSEPVPIWRWPLPKAYRPPADIPLGGPMGDEPPPSVFGEHWVDDLAVECLAEVASQQGELSLMLVRGGEKYVCRIDVATGKATMLITDVSGAPVEFSDDDGKTATSPTAETTVKGPGRYRLRLSNCDHEMLLWVNGSVVAFDGPTTYDSDDLLTPSYSAAEPGDLAPAGIAARGADVKVKQLRIYRDKYYIATTGFGGEGNNDYTVPHSGDEIRQIFRDPNRWPAPRGLFGPESRRHVEFNMEDNQFFPLGDNSPFSLDARYWTVRRPGDAYFEPHHFVERDLLIGKALVIYWPHTWNAPIPFLPKVSRMGPIR